MVLDRGRDLPCGRVGYNWRDCSGASLRPTNVRHGDRAAPVYRRADARRAPSWRTSASPADVAHRRPSWSSTNEPQRGRPGLRRAQALGGVLVNQTAEAVDALDRSGGVARLFQGDRRVKVDTPMRPQWEERPVGSSAGAAGASTTSDQQGCAGAGDDDAPAHCATGGCPSPLLLGVSPCSIQPSQLGATSG